MSFARLSLKGRALRLLALREHSRSELQAKLAPHVQEGEDLPALLDELEARDFINPRRVAESIVHSKAQRYGAARVAQQMRSKGLDAQLIGTAVEQLRATELQRAREVWRRRFDAPPATPQERARQMRFLLGRGFGGDVVRKVLGGAGDEDA